MVWSGNIITLFALLSFMAISMLYAVCTKPSRKLYHQMCWSGGWFLVVSGVRVLILGESFVKLKAASPASPTCTRLRVHVISYRRFRLPL